MALYREEFCLRNADVDCDRRLRWDVLFTLFQEAAMSHVKQLGFGNDKTLDRGLLWVIAMQQATITRLPLYEETVALETWTGKQAHTLFPRFYRLRDAEGGVLAEGSALWGLMDQTTRALVAPEACGVALDGAFAEEALPLPRPIRRVPWESRQQFTVPYSVLDLNGHMNNTRYFALAQDLLPPQARAQTPRQIAVVYSGEARLGETLQLGLAQTETGWYLEGESDRKVFRMTVTF